MTSTPGKWQYTRTSSGNHPVIHEGKTVDSQVLTGEVRDTDGNLVALVASYLVDASTTRSIGLLIKLSCLSHTGKDVFPLAMVEHSGVVGTFVVSCFTQFGDAVLSKKDAVASPHLSLVLEIAESLLTVESSMKEFLLGK